jgi:uncharacterized protein
MTAFHIAVHTIRRSVLPCLIAAALSVPPAQAQSTEPTPSARARVVVLGEGNVTVAPDYARIRSGVTTDGKTARQASDANTKLMSAVIQSLLSFGIARKDIQTTRFSIEPIYTSQSKLSGAAESKLSGYRVSNQVNVTIHQIAQVGDLLDRLIEAGATDAGNVSFLVSDREKPLDQAREAAIADARHKAELFARASGLNLGRVAWITESSDFEPIAPMSVERPKMASTPPPIEPGENTITARITVGFDIAQ